jgi:hypothetical protein
MSVFWTKIKAACWHSLTMAWGYVLMVGGVVLSNVDLMASLVTDKQISRASPTRSAPTQPSWASGSPWSG